MEIAIIGAGVTGLTAAYDLIHQGHHVTIYEAGKTIGGLAGGFKDTNWSWSVEYYYHHWFTSDKHIRQLLTELGWQKDFRLIKPKTVVYYQENFFPLDSLSAIFAFPGFNFVDVLRFGIVTGYLKYFSRWQALENSTAHQWLSRYYGRKIYRLIWEPLLQGKFGSYASKVTMAWMWARLKARTTNLATFTGGFQNFLDRFALHLKELGVVIHVNTPVKRLTSTKGRAILTLKNNKRVFDACLVTTSPSIFLKITPHLSPELKAYWQHTRSLGALLVLFSLTHPLSKEKYYWYNLPKNSGFPFLALVEHTNFISPKKVGGDHLIYCGDYLEMTDPRFAMSDQALIDLYQPALKKINSDFDPTWITKTWVFKTPYAQPVPFPGHSKNIPALETPLRGIYYAGMSHIYPWDRGTNFAVALGRQVAALIHKASHEKA